jgi:hypothetical protein
MSKRKPRQPSLTVADRARRAAEDIERIAAAAISGGPAASQLEAPLQLADAITYNMSYVHDWVERRRGPQTAEVLWQRMDHILRAMHKVPQRSPEGVMVLSLFPTAREFAWSLRNWASDIEAEENGVGTTPAIQSLPAQASPGETPPADRSKGIPRAEAEIRVRQWLAANAKDDPASITRDAVASETGVSKGGVSNTAAWKAFSERRDAEAKPGAREVPLTDCMQAAIPADCESPDEVAALIEEQAKEEAEQERRHESRRERRHGPS